MGMDWKRGLVVILSIIIVIGLVNYVASCGGGGTVETATTTTAVTTTSTASVTTTTVRLGPSVVSVSPADGATGVVMSASTPTDIKATCDKGIDLSSISNSSLTLSSPEGAVAGTVSYDEATKTLTFHSSQTKWFYDRTYDLLPGVTYTATVSGDIKDFIGNTMGTPYSWSFTVQEQILPPTITPATGSYSPGASVSATITSVPGAIIYYTIDRSDPRHEHNRTLYTGPISLTISQAQYVKAYATKAGLIDSNVAIAIYSLPSSGSTWHVMGDGFTDAASSVIVDGSNNVYVGSKGVYKWDGSNWNVLGGAMNHFVTAMTFGAKSDLYAGGYFTSADGVPANLVAKWNGSSWSALADSFDGFQVNALAYDGANNILYAGGNINKIMGGWVAGIFKYDGSSWSSWGFGANADVLSLIIGPGNKLYAGGYFTRMVSYDDAITSRIASWNGVTWEALGQGMWDVPTDPSGSASVAGMAYDTAHNILYAGGQFNYANASPASNIAKWNGSAWSALGSGINSLGVGALAYDSAHNILYAGGYFGIAGGSPAYYVAQWNGSSWQALGAGMDAPVSALALDSAGNLYAVGNFTIAGDVAANHVARWGP